MDYSYQMYSARNEASLDDTLKTLAGLGYKQVEGWGGQFADPAALSQSLRNAGLTMPTAHMGYGQLEDTDAALRIVEQVGIDRPASLRLCARAAGSPNWPPQPSTCA